MSIYGKIYTILYGDPNSRDGPCMEMSYDLSDKIKLDSVSYYKRCSNNKPLKKSDGTREMIQSLLYCVLAVWDNIQKVILKDVSFFECDGANVLLSYHDLLLYGKTWYERHFNAKPVDLDVAKRLEEIKALLLEKPKNGVFTFCKKSDVSNWHEYFMDMKTKYGCMFFVKHFTEIKAVLNINLLYSDWSINRHDIMIYKDVVRKITKYKTPQKGGFHIRYIKKQCLTDN